MSDGSVVDVAAAVGTSTTDPSLMPPHRRQDLFVPLLGAKAPLYSSVAKYPTPDFNPIEVPRTLTETGLSGTPTDEVTPEPAGTITTDLDTITIAEVEGSYQFSRKLLLGSNPAIDRIAEAAMNRAWLADIETRLTAFFTAGANSTPAAGAYADGEGFIAAVRAAMADLASGTVFAATVVIPPAKEYEAAANANDTTGRPLLPYGPQVNSSGESGAGYESLKLQGVDVLPSPYEPANKTLLLDQAVDAAVAWITPVFNFRLEWTPSGAMGNPKVLQLTKYSGLGCWTQYQGGVIVMTNTTPLPLAGAAAGSSSAKGK